MPAAERQSYVETGSAQVLDHIVVTNDLVPTETRLLYAHIDSDFPLVNLNDATSPTRISIMTRRWLTLWFHRLQS